MSWAEKKVTGKAAFRFGSYGWSAVRRRELAEIVERNKMNWNFLESVEFEGAQRKKDLLNGGSQSIGAHQDDERKDS
jgi:flavorubredoxin